MNSTENTIAEGLSTEEIAMGSYLCIASFLGLISNLLIIFTIRFGKNVGKQVKIQLIHLAVVDLLWSTLYLTYLWTVTFYLSLLSTVSGCKVYMFIAHSALLASPITSAAISIERAFIVYFPFKVALYRDIHKYIVIAIIWLYASSTQIPFTLEQDLAVWNGLSYCTFYNYPLYLSWIEATSYFTPVLIVVTSYSLVIIKLCRRKRSHMISESTTQPQSNTDKVLLMLIVDASLTLLTWMPSKALQLIDELIPDPNFTFSKSAVDPLKCLFYTNAFSTFIIYSIFNKNFRMDFCQLFKRVCCKLTSYVMANTDSSDVDIGLVRTRFR